jgi:hypothetical protein
MEIISFKNTRVIAKQRAHATMEVVYEAVFSAGRIETSQGVSFSL